MRGPEQKRGMEGSSLVGNARENVRFPRGKSHFGPRHGGGISTTPLSLGRPRGCDR